MATTRTKPIHETPTPVDEDMILYSIRSIGRILDDIEHMRIQIGNRVGAGRREGKDQPWMDVSEEYLSNLEHTLELQLKRAWRKHHLAPWSKTIPGIMNGTLLPRLIAEVGNPSDRPNPGKLLAYCGHGDPERSVKRKGMSQEDLFAAGNPNAKKATWKIAYQFMRTVGSEPTTRPPESSAVTSAPALDAASTPPDSIEPSPRLESAATNGRPKPIELPSRRSARSPYRDIYEERKTATEGKLHERACLRCGPSGKPALPGSPWSDAHRHADALRIVGKRFLVDLWVADLELRPS